MVLQSVCSKRSFRGFLLKFVLMFVLCAPLLLFNGYGWYHVTFLYKWLGAFLPLAYLAGFLGVMLLADREHVRVDFFAVAWLVLLLFLPLQLVLPNLPNRTEWLRNWLFLAGMGGGYLVFLNFSPLSLLPAALRTLLSAGALSTAFGFIQQAKAVGNIPFILFSPLADRFLANTGMDGILGTVLALASFSGVWLLTEHVSSCSSSVFPAGLKRSVCEEETERGPEWGQGAFVKKRFLFFFDGALLFFNLVGMWKAGARSPMIAFFCALCVLLFLRSLCERQERREGARLILSPGAVKKVFLLVLAGAIFFVALPRLFPVQRRDIQADLSIEAFSPAREGRFAIWGLTLEMIGKHPLFGVGLGNYKWNYLDSAQAFQQRWGMEMIYTFWAHNEYLQWIAETGGFGVIFLTTLFFWWGKKLRLHLSRERVSSSFQWGAGIVVLLSVDALFSRPFHHVESALWFPFALAVINADMLREKLNSRISRAAFGGAVTVLSAFGLFTFVESLPMEREFAWVPQPMGFVIVLGEQEIALPGAPLLLRDAAKEARWKQSLMRARLDGREKFYREAADHIEDDYAIRPRLAILPEMVEIHQKLGDNKRIGELIACLSPRHLAELGLTVRTSLFPASGAGAEKDGPDGLGQNKKIEPE